MNAPNSDRGVVFLNGEFVPIREARIGVFNGGWLHGAGLFETMRAENGRAFRYDAHLARLCHSAKVLLAPLDHGALPDADTIRRLMDENGFQDGRVRLTVTAGDMLTTPPTNGAKRPLTICATVAELGDYPGALYKKGATVMIAPYRQWAADPLAGHKSTCYLPRLLGLRRAREAGCDEALWFTLDNLLAEGCISNVFVVRTRTIFTPPLDTPVLPGITRAVVMDLARASGLEIVEKPITIDELLDADEVFLTNSIMQVLPVGRVEKRDIGSGQCGPVAKDLFERYRRCVIEECTGHD